MEPDILDRPARPESFKLLAQQGVITPDELEQALRITGVIPDGARWANFLNKLFLFLGAMLLAAGVIFFFAYNWAAMHRLLKLGVVQIALLAAVMTASYLGFERLTGKAALLVASILTGAFLALYGQIYQTGADAYELFVGWSALIAGWVIIGNFAPLWFLQLILVQAGIYLYWGQVLESEWFIYRSPVLYEILFGINVVALAVWELFSSRGVGWLRGRWIPRTIVDIALFLIVVPLVILIVDGHAFSGHTVSAGVLPVLYLVFAGIVVWIYQTVLFDLFMVASALLSAIVVISVFFGHAIGSNYGGFLLLSMIIVALSGGAGVWLRNLARSQTKGAR